MTFICQKFEKKGSNFEIKIYRIKKNRPKMTFDFGCPWNPVDMTFHKVLKCFIILGELFYE
jgi:hypothetical protein